MKPVAGDSSSPRHADDPPVVALTGITKRYGELVAVDGVDLTVERGGRHGLIGPNGAGKTTLFNMVGGRTDVSSGTIWLNGTDITGVPEHLRARMGISKTFQHSSLFDGLSAIENVAMATQRQANIAHRLWRPARRHREVTTRALELLEMAGLGSRTNATAGLLSHGERRQLEIAVALATEPEIVLLDEPVAGMSPAESAAFIAMVGQLPPSVTVLIIEHDMDVIFSVATRISVLHLGQVLAEGTPEEIRASPEVEEAYLGVEHTDDLFYRR